VYVICDKLVRKTQEAFRDGTENNLRWYITLDRTAYMKTLSTYMKIYLNTTLRGKRSIITHFNAIEFDLTRLVDHGFRSFLTEFLSLDNLLDFLMIYLSEGYKSIIRFTYSILKNHKGFLKAQTDASTVLPLYVEVCQNKTDIDLLIKYAFKINIGSAKQYAF